MMVKAIAIDDLQKEQKKKKENQKTKISNWEWLIWKLLCCYGRKPMLNTKLYCAGL